MIRVSRIGAPPATQRLLDLRTAAVTTKGGTSADAREEWKKATTPKKHVRELLQKMAFGVQRCMYCEDSLGTDIDHFQPIAQAPARAFVWSNHLLSCSHCNSNEKRDEYPCDPAGNCLLVDPTAEDPAVHLGLLLASGLYQARTVKGEETIRVFGLNRPDLVRGRQAAFVVACAVLRDWHRHWKVDDSEEAKRIAGALQLSPFAGVISTMAGLPPTQAVLVLGAEAASAAASWHEVYGSGQKTP